MFGRNQIIMSKHKLECKCPFCKAKRGEMKGKNHFMYNRHHTKKSRKKISQQHADVSGEKNPNFGNHKLKGKYKGINHPNFKGKHIHKGYVLIWCPNHPKARNKKYVAEHRLVMEAFLNKVSLKKWISYGLKGNYPKNVRFLTKEEVVHHINEIRNDNRLKNLKLFKNHSEHQKFHLLLYFYLIK